jgi:RNA polymerase sigma factor (sigma-70 family)
MAMDKFGGFEACPMATGQIGSVIHYLRHMLAPQDGGERTDAQLLEGFISQRDEIAFAALVRRHGPMVLGVCRRLLNHAQDAEDAFQATFLVLVRRAASVLPREMVGNWLYGVAYRTALEAKTAAAKRRVKERAMRPKAAFEEDAWAELKPVLDFELSRLPDKYRVPIVLCDLEGKTRKEAARQLGWPEGTVAGRLARARVLLANRLTKRGLALSTAAVPATLVMTTVRAATGIAAGQAAAGGYVSVQVAALIEGVMKVMLVNKLKNVTAFLAILSLIGLGVGSAAYQSIAAEPAPTAASPAFNAAPAPAEDAKPSDRVELPKDFPPQQALAKVDKEGQITVKNQVNTYKVVTTPGPGPGQTTAAMVPETSIIATNYKSDEYSAHDVKGKKIEPKDLAKRLEKEALVLTSNSGKPVDPLHLRLMKEDTIVLVLPLPQAAVPPTPAGAAAVPFRVPLLPAVPAVAVGPGGAGGAFLPVIAPPAAAPPLVGDYGPDITITLPAAPAPSPTPAKPEKPAEKKPEKPAEKKSEKP